MVLRYSSACKLGVTSQGTRSTTRTPARSRASTLSGLFESKRTRVTPSALRISAGRVKSRWSALEAEALVGFDRVEAGVLQFVGLQLGHQADAASFLLLVDQDAGAFVADHRQRKFELLAAIAAQGMEDVAGQALGMDAHQRRRGLHVAHHQSNGFFHADCRPAGCSARKP